MCYLVHIRWWTGDLHHAISTLTGNVLHSINMSWCIAALSFTVLVWLRKWTKHLLALVAFQVKTQEQLEIRVCSNVHLCKTDKKP